MLLSPTHANYSALIADVERGDVKIPQFQLDFVWALQKPAAATNDFDEFLSSRAKAIGRLLQKRLFSREVDEGGQLARVDDYEEELTAFE